MDDSFRITDYLICSILAFTGDRADQAWIVGGFVRDALLGRRSHDLDLIVPGHGIELAAALSRAFHGDFFVLDRERDVARAILTRPDGETVEVDVARLRVPDLAGDLALRDFTINAIASPVPGRALLPGAEVGLIDPFDGRADLAQGLIRAVGDAAFRDDPLRTLRAVRQAVELGFHLDDSTCDLILRDGHLLAGVAAERIRDELLRVVAAPGAWQHLRLLAQLDLLRPTLPELQALIGVTQSAPHYLDAFDHTRSVLAHAEGILALLWPDGPYGRPARAAPVGGPGGDDVAPGPDCARPAGPDPIQSTPDGQWAVLAGMLAPYADDLRGHLLEPLAAGRTRRDLFLWAALAHDWGKATTRSVGADWRVHFYDHDHQGASMVENRLRLLAFSAAEAGYAGRMVDLHMRPGHLTRHYPPSQRALYRFYRDAGAIGPDIALLAIADKMATRGPQVDYEAEFLPNLMDVAAQVFSAYFREHETRVDPALLLDGRQVMAELGLAPGPRVGKLIEGLREAQAVGEVTTIDEACAWLHHHHESESG
ncbi:MAG TPA: HD domain-containing protein [Anaerolineae bacterium]